MLVNGGRDLIQRLKGLNMKTYTQTHTLTAWRSHGPTASFFCSSRKAGGLCLKEYKVGACCVKSDRLTVFFAPLVCKLAPHLVLRFNTAPAHGRERE